MTETTRGSITAFLAGILTALLFAAIDALMVIACGA